MRHRSAASLVRSRADQADGEIACRCGDRCASGDYRRRMAGPREHGRQAARSQRDRPEWAGYMSTDSAKSTPPQAAS